MSTFPGARRERRTRLVAPIALCTVLTWSSDALTQKVSPELKPGAAKALAEEKQTIAALMGGEDEDDEGIGDYHLDFYGFADVTYLGGFFNNEDSGVVTPYPSFALGRLNLYMAAEMGEGWRTLSEIRYTYLPNGSTAPGALLQGDYERVDNIVGDHTDLNRPVPVGGIIIERAWLEKTVEPWLSFRLGQFLTPYGIWNVDHGSPVILAMRKPFIISEAIFPERQVGLQMHGTSNYGPLSYGYYLTVSNGRGKIPYRDMDKNKGLGWRFTADYDTSVGLFSGGYSGYIGDYTERLENSSFTANGIVTTRNITSHYHEQATALDFKWTLGGALVQSEFLLEDKTYNDDTRTLTTVLGPPGQVGAAADSRRKGLYGIAGYRFEWLGLMPWGGGSVMELTAGNYVKELFLGLNIRPHSRVVFKASYTRVTWPESIFPKSQYLDLQTAWSF